MSHYSPLRPFKPIGAIGLVYQYGDDGDMDTGPTQDLTVHYDKFGYVRITDDVMGHHPEDGEFMTLPDALEEIRRNVMQLVNERVKDAGGTPIL